MKKGFALLETLIVITFISVSLLLLYGTFTNMVNNSKKNILYDDASNIYKAYYTKEYLKLYGLNTMTTDSIKKITCNDFYGSGCEILLNKLNVDNIYLAKVGVKDIDTNLYSKNLFEYLNTLTNKSEYEYRLILEFISDKEYSYASIGINGDYNE